jgi:hypothetical protein
VHQSAVGDRTAAAVAGRRTGRRRWLAVAALVLFVVGSLLLWESTKSGDGGEAAGQSAAGLGHIHGIGINPADGRWTPR